MREGGWESTVEEEEGEGEAEAEREGEGEAQCHIGHSEHHQQQRTVRFFEDVLFPDNALIRFSLDSDTLFFQPPSAYRLCDCGLCGSCRHASCRCQWVSKSDKVETPSH